MILGIGTDIVKISRITKVVERFGIKFVRHILTDREQQQYQKSLLKIQFLASRFAAKEACAKALGTGFAKGITFKSFCLKNIKGKPQVELLDKALSRSQQTHQFSQIHLTLSHEKEYAIAFVIWESN